MPLHTIGPMLGLFVRSYAYLLARSFVSSFDVLLVCLFVVCLLICLFFRFVAVSTASSAAIALLPLSIAVFCVVCVHILLSFMQNITNFELTKDVMLT